MIKLIGSIEKRGFVKILIIHSKKLSKEVNKRGNKISIKNYKDGLEIEPAGETHVTIASKKRLQIAITKLINKGYIIINDNDKIPVYLDSKKWNINKNEILAKSIGNPISKIIPNNLVIKNAAIRSNKENFYLDISSKKFYEISRKQKTKCLFNRIKDSIIIIRSDNISARKLTPHSQKRIQIAIPKELLTNIEIKKIKEIGWLPIKLKLNIESFGLRIDDFYSIKEEKELVKYLINKGIKIKIKEPADSYDILLEKEGIAIEIHNSIPRYGDLITRHKIKPGMIRLRILEADFLIKNKELSKFYVIINKEWENGKYINELIMKINKNVKVFFTDFKNKWEEEMGKNILKNL